MLPALKNGRGFLRSVFGFNQRTFGGFLFHRSALLRRISGGFTSGLPGPRSCDKRTIHQNLRLISPFSRTQPYGASGKGSSPPKPENDARSPIGRPFAARAWPIAGGPQFAGKSTTPPRTGSSIRWCTDRRPVPAVHHLSPHGDLIEHRSDFREFPRLPGMIGDDTCAVSAHIIRVGQLGSVTVLRPGQVHNHCDRQPFFHFVAKAGRGLQEYARFYWSLWLQGAWA
jgi:hypothetical protein